DMGDRGKALEAVNELEQLRNEGAAGYRQLTDAKIHAIRGGVLMQLNDLDHALDEFKAATATTVAWDAPSAGNAWLRLGEIHDLKGQRAQAIAAYREAMRVAPETDAAMLAKTYVGSRYKKPAA
ncbi:MAG TPA: tetratricopeptide repeat protein, partial [Bryobacteraceae bacterium]|nr:tetratricopeptide repeat protein [Bryobacteraceae bacterium]